MVIILLRKELTQQTWVAQTLHIPEKDLLSQMGLGWHQGTELLEGSGKSVLYSLESFFFFFLNLELHCTVYLVCLNDGICGLTSAFLLERQ